MRKEPVIVIVVLVMVILIAGYVIFTTNNSRNGEVQTSFNDLLPIKSQGLGSLCSSEAECNAFCLNNRGMCESYCRGNENELCRIIFPPEKDSAQSAQVQKKETCISNPSPLFTSTFTDIDKIAGVSQFGNNGFYNPGSQARSYVFIAESEITTVYAPVNATITHIYYSDKNYSGYIRPEYRIDIDVSCEVHIAFDHIVNISDWLKPFAPQVPSPGRNPGVEVNVPVKAGDTIGFTTGTYRGSKSGGFDFLILNKARHLPRLNEARWTTDHSLYYGCPYDYFTPNLKQQYYALLQKENAESSCGPRVKEVVGTPQGYWFQGNAIETQGNRFVIYEGNHFVEWTIISKEDEKLQYYRTHEKNSVSLAQINEGKSACYQDKEKNAYVFLKMLANDSLSLAAGTGACPSAFLENQGATYYR